MAMPTRILIKVNLILIQYRTRKEREWALGIGHWALGIGHGGMNYPALPHSPTPLLLHLPHLPHLPHPPHPPCPI